MSDGGVKPGNGSPTTVDTYDRPLVPAAFDLLISTVFLPFGGIRKLRSRALDLLEIKPGARVIELGCGTGGITKLLIERGARVTAIDGSERMLKKARRRAPQATFERQRLESLELGGEYDLALFAFVLHELPREMARRALASAAEVLAHDGMLAVLDHALPASSGFAQAWRGFLTRLEPATVVECIEQGYETEVLAAGGEVVARHDLAAGTAALMVARLKEQGR